MTGRRGRCGSARRLGVAGGLQQVLVEQRLVDAQGLAVVGVGVGVPAAGGAEHLAAVVELGVAVLQADPRDRLVRGVAVEADIAGRTQRGWQGPVGVPAQ